VVVYWNQPGYRGTTWWWLEFGSVVFAIGAMWMDAFRYRLNWWAWTISNCLSAPLFWHGRLWGPFWTIFVYQALNIYGWFEWTRAQRDVRAPRPELEDDSGGAPSALGVPS
jgi:nicotinamide riboside transporter PnuC